MSLLPQSRRVDSSELRSPNGRPQPRQPIVPHLTGRECEIMHWLAEGKRNREIAIILGLSPRTIEKHVGHILEKFQVETRTAAVHQHGLNNRSFGRPTVRATNGNRELASSSHPTKKNHPDREKKP